MDIQLVTATDVAKLVPYPAKKANKYTRGKLTVIGGSNEYPGAACMASSAALRSGPGYVEVFCDSASLPIVQGHDPNIVARDWSGFSCDSSKLSVASSGHPKACLIGSGFSTPNQVQDDLLHEVLESAQCPVVVDGGALETLASDRFFQIAKKRFEQGRTLVLTPHYGEADRLARPLGLTPPEKQFAEVDNDAEFAKALSEAYGATVVLKGWMTLIADAAQDRFYLMDEGPACLAKAGTGDVLAGMTAAFLAQGLAPLDATRLSTLTHARSAMIAEKELTSVCVCATDVIDCLPRAFALYDF